MSHSYPDYDPDNQPVCPAYVFPATDLAGVDTHNVYVYGMGVMGLFQIGVQASSAFEAAQDLASGRVLMAMEEIHPQGAALAQRLFAEPFRILGVLTPEEAWEAIRRPK